MSLSCGPSDLEGLVDGPAATDSTWSEIDAPIEDSAHADADEAADAATSDAAPCVPVSSGEVCNGLDDDCDGTADDGFPGLGTECDVGLGACERTGIVVCTADGSGVVCNATPGVPGPAELCGTGIDENCNGAVDEGFSLGAPCDGPDSDLCNEGVLVCTADRLGTRCSDMTGNSAEACNGLDDDCDGSVDEGLGLGTPCDGTDGDLCNEGVLACNGSGGTMCTDSSPTDAELCNSMDDDCDGAVDEGYTIGIPCDGVDFDLCNEGVTVCNGAGTGTLCTDANDADPDVCNNIDDDCNPATTDGAADSRVAVPCDGTDADLCNEGMTYCSLGAVLCGDSNDADPDVCNGVDDDCNPSTADGSADARLGMPCDGTDTDLCNEGVFTGCAGGLLLCSDPNDVDSELCNNVDDNCNGSIDEGFNLATDASNCGTCGNACTNPNGTTSCVSGACTPLCNAGFQNCDGNNNTGCELNRDDGPACTGGTYNLGTVSGDTGMGILTDSWNNEEWDRVTISEDSSSTIYLSAMIELINPPGVDYDLYVYCYSCGGTLAGSSTLGAGQTDVVYYRKEDVLGPDDTRDVVIEIRYYNATLCGDWTLRVTGNAVAASTTCF